MAGSALTQAGSVSGVFPVIILNRIGFQWFFVYEKGGTNEPLFMWEDDYADQ